MSIEKKILTKNSSGVITDYILTTASEFSIDLEKSKCITNLTSGLLIPIPNAIVATNYI